MLKKKLVGSYGNLGVKKISEKEKKGKIIIIIKTEIDGKRQPTLGASTKP